MQPKIVVYEDNGWQKLLPLVYIRAVFQLVCGMGDLLGRVRSLAGDNTQPWCRAGLAEVVAEQTRLPTNAPQSGPTLFLNGRGLWHRLPDVHASDTSWVGIAGSRREIACIFADADLAARLSPAALLDEAQSRAALAGIPRRELDDSHVRIFDWPWEIVLSNEHALVADWHRTVAGRAEIHGTIAEGSYLLARKSIHVGEGTRIKPCVVLDAEDGPVWIGRNVKILPHSYVEGPAFIGDGCLLQPGSVVHAGTTIGPRSKVGGEIEASIIQGFSNKQHDGFLGHSYVEGPAFIGDGCLLQPGSVVHAGTTIGPRSKVGGEIEASIIQGFSNKQHDGFLGHSYVGSWVNIAADCINSDLKNTYGTIRVPINGRDVETGEMFVGMLVGDYSKAGINVSFPTGAVIGFSSSVFASRSPKFVPSFAWLDGETVTRYDEERGLAIAEKVMARRDRVMTPAEKSAFMAVRQLALAIEHQPQRSLEQPGR